MTIAGSAVLATVVGAVVLLRAKPVAHDVLPVPATLPAAARELVRAKMVHHEAQMQALVSRVVLLDDDGVARAAGEIFDEPGLTPPAAGDELHGLIPQRFFTLQNELKTRARQLVIASGSHDREAVATEFAALARSCVGCHQVFVHGEISAAPTRPTR